MNVNIPRRARVLIYLANVIGTPAIAYALAKGWIGPLEVTLWGAEVAAVMALAGLNVKSDGAPQMHLLTSDQLDKYGQLYASRDSLARSVGESAKQRTNQG